MPDLAAHDEARLKDFTKSVYGILRDRLARDDRARGITMDSELQPDDTVIGADGVFVICHLRSHHKPLVSIVMSDYPPRLMVHEVDENRASRRVLLNVESHVDLTGSSLLQTFQLWLDEWLTEAHGFGVS